MRALKGVGYGSVLNDMVRNIGVIAAVRAPFVVIPSTISNAFIVGTAKSPHDPRPRIIHWYACVESCKPDPSVAGTAQSNAALDWLTVFCLWRRAQTSTAILDEKIKIIRVVGVLFLQTFNICNKNGSPYENRTRLSRLKTWRPNR